MIDHTCFRRCSSLVIAIALIAPVVAPQPADAQAPTTRPRRQAINYKARASDAPESRVGGASRGSEEDKDLYVTVLAPCKAGVGLTLAQQPTLLWYLSKDTDKKIRIGINRLDEQRTIFLKTLRGPHKAGIQALDLSKLVDERDRMAALEPGVRYEWVVTVVVSDKAGSNNPDAVGTVERIAADAELTKALQQPDALDRANALAERSVWYDSLALLQQEIARSLNDAELRMLRVGLLKQEHLIEAADGKIEDRCGKKTDK